MVYFCVSGHMLRIYRVRIMSLLVSGVGGVSELPIE
jgi:hypothetical protein